MLSTEWSRPVCVLLVGGVAWFAQSQVTMAEEEEATRKSIGWRTSYAKAAIEAGSKERPILIEFTATWCGACRQMQQLTFRDQRVIDYLDSAYVPLKIDADEHSDLVSGFRVEAFPTTLVVSPELKIVKRFTGYQSASTLLPELEKIVQEQFAGREVVQPVSATKPANTSPFAFDGFCLVGILDDQKLRQGNPEFTTTHRDQVVCFHSADHLQKFQANPDKYWPAANGKCLVSERDARQKTIGDPRVGVTWRGRLWFFTDKAHQRRFIQSPRKYVADGM